MQWKQKTLVFLYSGGHKRKAFNWVWNPVHMPSTEFKNMTKQNENIPTFCPPQWRVAAIPLVGGWRAQTPFHRCIFFLEVMTYPVYLQLFKSKSGCIFRWPLSCVWISIWALCFSDNQSEPYSHCYIKTEIIFLQWELAEDRCSSKFHWRNCFSLNITFKGIIPIS